jgi:hypothetical protein
LKDRADIFSELNSEKFKQQKNAQSVLTQSAFSAKHYPFAVFLFLLVIHHFTQNHIHDSEKTILCTPVRADHLNIQAQSALQ